MIKGLIAIWSGAIADIPTGWHLCNGLDGTPDLRDRFVVGAGLQFDPGDTGGAETHTHTFTGDGHNHDIPVGTAIETGNDYAIQTDSAQVVGTTDSASSLPAYYALAFIMKL